MKKAISFFLLVASFLAQQSLDAQPKYFTKSGAITFSATGPIKNIRGENKKATFQLDPKTGNIQVALLMAAFEFPRTIFKNVDYLESDRYPKSFYKGKITNLGSIDLSKDGSYPITLEGDLTLHGVTRNVAGNGILLVHNGKVSTKAKFLVDLEDFNVSIPAILVNDRAVSIDIAAWFDQ